MDVAFDPADPNRGYAVGKRRRRCCGYGKSWEPEGAAAGLRAREPDLDRLRRQRGDRRRRRRPAGQRRRRPGASTPPRRRCSTRVRTGNPQLYAVAGLPDGGAVAAGRDIVIERDGPSAPWRFSDQPLPGSTAIAAAARSARAPRCARSSRSSRSSPTRRPTTCPARPQRAAADHPAVRAARRRLPAARDRQRLGGRAAHRLRRLRRRPADQERPDPGAAARLVRKRLGGRRLERHGGCRRSRHLRERQRSGARSASECRPQRSPASAPVRHAAPTAVGSAAGADAGRADSARRGRQRRVRQVPARTSRPSRSAPTAP